jgi:ribosome biogenesis GTPase A
MTASEQAVTAEQKPSRGKQHGGQRGTSYADAKVHRARLVGIGRTLEKIAGSIGNTRASATVVALLERVETDVFHVMVVGDFNRGKSTFVNALLGRQVLPVKATSATAVIT